VVLARPQATRGFLLCESGIVDFTTGARDVNLGLSLADSDETEAEECLGV